MENKFELIANALGELDEEQFMEELFDDEDDTDE